LVLKEKVGDYKKKKKMVGLAEGLRAFGLNQLEEH
jgi:hypothetical protein